MEREDSARHAPGSGVTLALAPALIPGFFRFLQEGVAIRARVGCSVREFLCDQIGLSPEYVEKRIQTVFLDGKAIDDLDSSLIRKGSTLTLSAAMPGLLGATLRVGSYYAAMRSQISYHEEGRPFQSGEAPVVLKVFNLLTREIGPDLLKRGVRIRGKALGDFLRIQPPRFWEGCREATLDGVRIDPDRLAGIEWGEDLLLLSIRET